MRNIRVFLHPKSTRGGRGQINAQHFRGTRSRANLLRPPGSILFIGELKINLSKPKLQLMNNGGDILRRICSRPFVTLSAGGVALLIRSRAVSDGGFFDCVVGYNVIGLILKVFLYKFRY